MSYYLGIDTSNYTTSIAVHDSLTGKVIHQKKLLPVKEDTLGLKQSDAVFAHVKQLPQITEELFFGIFESPVAVGASVKPRDKESSYMPCFLVGKLAAQTLASINHIPVHFFSHQAGHIAAALYSCGRLDLVSKEFIAFHFSGGTTECVHVSPCLENIFSCNILFQSLDLKCGQAIDRVGHMLGLSFPAGKELDDLSQQSNLSWKIKPTFQGENCCISGLENQCSRHMAEGMCREDIAKYCIEYVCAVVEHMAKMVQEKYPELPLVFSGGVMSNSLIRERISEKFGGLFATPEFSADNAAGVAILTWVKEGFHA